MRIEQTNRYVLTPDGIAMAVFYTKVHSRLLRPPMAARQPQAPPALRDALHAIDRHVDRSIRLDVLPEQNPVSVSTRQDGV
jgi:hypothetical protein